MYLKGERATAFALLSTPAEPGRGGRGVLLCPPFGWDEICSYRSLRAWAQELAEAGFPALRLELPGTGDSAGDARDPGIAAEWAASIAGAAAWLREDLGCEALTGIGIGLGGLLLCQAISQGAPVEEIVLWSTPGRGRAFLRELRAFGALEEGSQAPAAAESDGSIWAGGFAISAETAKVIEAMSVEQMEFPAGRPSRALLLGRDGIAPDQRLSSALQGKGVAVREAPGEGWGRMTAKPHVARAPREVFAEVLGWLGGPGAASGGSGPPSGGSGPASGKSAPPGGDSAAVGAPAASAAPWVSDSRMELADGAVQERPYEVPWAGERLFGVLSEPTRHAGSDMCVLLLNAGAIRHIGPNRMWVEAARRWAAGQGVPVLRLDLEGIGESDGDGERFDEMAELYAPEMAAQVQAALDVLERDGLGSRFVLSGLCSGACWSFLAVLDDPRARAALMLNPRALFWDPTLDAVRDYRRGARRVSSWRKALASGEVTPARVFALVREVPVAIPRRALSRRRARRGGGDRLDHAFDTIRDAGKRLHFRFSGDEPLLEELESEGRLAAMPRWPNITIGHLPGQVHTLRPPEAQRAAHASLDACLQEELEREAAAGRDLTPS